MDMLTNMGFEPLDDGTLVLRVTEGSKSASVTVRQVGDDFEATYRPSHEGAPDFRFSSSDLRDIAAFAIAVGNEAIYDATGNYPEDEGRVFDFEDICVLNPFADLQYGEFITDPAGIGTLQVRSPLTRDIKDKYIAWRDARFVDTPRPAGP